VARDYRVLTRAAQPCGIYLQGGTEHTHGITSSLLSNTSIRAGEILQSVLSRRDTAAPRAAGNHHPRAGAKVPT
jgi:L-ornithine N5-monooxygenase